MAGRLVAGETDAVQVPSVEYEHLRDLLRCRADIRRDLVRARHRGKYLLRREIYYQGRAASGSLIAPRS